MSLCDELQQEAISIAVLMTCHNRRATTVTCLEALKRAAPSNVILAVYIVDDGSTDGTAEAIAEVWPDARIIHGSGNLYWNGGMRAAWQEALPARPNFFMWLNDDLSLFPNAIASMLEAFQAHCVAADGKVVIVGKTISPKTGEVTYGGYVRANGISRLRFRRLMNGESKCDTANGNCLLIPFRAVEDIGINDAGFTHAFGDIDYGLRVVNAEYLLAQCPQPVGYQEINYAFKNSHQRLTIWNAGFLLSHPKGIPVVQWFRFCRRHGGPLWPMNFFARYAKILAWR